MSYFIIAKFKITTSAQLCMVHALAPPPPPPTVPLAHTAHVTRNLARRQKSNGRRVIRPRLSAQCTHTQCTPQYKREREREGPSHVSHCLVSPPSFPLPNPPPLPPIFFLSQISSSSHAALSLCFFFYEYSFATVHILQ